MSETKTVYVVQNTYGSENPSRWLTLPNEYADKDEALKVCDGLNLGQPKKRSRVIRREMVITEEVVG